MTEPGATSLLDITRSIAERFLYSVVLIDDKVIHGPLLQEDALIADGAALVEPGRVGAPDAEPLPESIEIPAVRANAADHPLYAPPVVSGFAERGLICAVLQLDTPEDRHKMLPAAKRADIVILDWKMHKKYGTVTIDIIREILASDTDRLRLIAIYTGEPTLAKITAQLAGEFGGTGAQTRAFEVRNGALKIVVYAKGGMKLPEEDPELHARIADAAALPEKLLGDFARMTTGLVSNVALDALAQVRANMHRILQRLHPGLDAAYLTHRVLVVPPEEAEKHLVALVAAEVATVLDETGVGKHADLKAIELWLQDRITQQADFRKAFGLAAGTDPLPLLLKLLEQGPGHADLQPPLSKFSTSANIRLATGRFSNPDGDGVNLDNEFAMRLILRTPPLGALTPFLTLGSILMRKTGDTPEFYVCVQPACDAERLKAKRAFPLVPLRRADESTGFDIVIALRTGDLVQLRSSTKPYDLLLVTFEPDTKTRTVIAGARSKDDPTLVFASAEGEFEWLGDLKPDHAQRIAETLGRQQTRIAVVESERMRRSRGSESE